MKKALLLLLPLLFISCAKDNPEWMEEVLSDDWNPQEAVEEAAPEPEEITYPTMREYVDLMDSQIRAHFYDVIGQSEEEIPTEDFISVIDEENYYVKFDYQTEDIPLESSELDAALTVFLRKDGSHLVAFQSQICPRSMIPCFKTLDFYDYQNGELVRNRIDMDSDISFLENSDDPQAQYLGYYWDLPRFDAVLRMRRAHTAMDENCSPQYYEDPQQVVRLCDWDEMVRGGDVKPYEIVDMSYTPGAVIAEYQWNGESFQLIRWDLNGLEE